MVNATRVDMYNYPEAIVNNGIHPEMNTQYLLILEQQ